jgi:hypothetical protein
MQQRKDEILAKKARLAELKRQRELRRDEFTKERQSVRDAAEVGMQFVPIWEFGLLQANAEIAASSGSLFICVASGQPEGSG